MSVAGIAASLLVPLALVASAPAASANAATLPASPAGGCASPCTLNFGYTGAVQDWTIPAGTTQLLVTSKGASGANGIGETGGAGAPGALVVNTTVDVAVGTAFQPGDTLEIFAGGAGGDPQLAVLTGGAGGSGSSCNCGAETQGFDGGQGGGGSGVADSTTGQWISIAGGGGGGGGGTTLNITGNDGGGNALPYTGGLSDCGISTSCTSCTPPGLASPSGPDNGASGDSAIFGSSSAGGGGGGGGCPGGAGGQSGSDVSPDGQAPGTAGASAAGWGLPNSGAFAFEPFCATMAGGGCPTADGSVTIEYTYSPPALTTTPNVTSANAGTTLTDTATLSGLDTLPGLSPVVGPPGGTITFSLYYNGGSTPVYSKSVTVCANVNPQTGCYGNGSYTTPTGYVASAPGMYQWDADYSGDTLPAGGTWNAPVSDDNNPGEVVTVSPASPALTVAPTAPTLQLGTAPGVVTATATLSGGYDESGTITFTLLKVTGSSTGAVVDTTTRAVAGNGNYAAPGGGLALPATGQVTGTYQVEASYSGDGSNNGTTSEPVPTDVDPAADVTVTPAAPTLNSTPNETSVTYGQAPTLTDTATLSEAYDPTGSLTFTLDFTPGNIPFGTIAQTSQVDSETVPVSGNGTYATPTGYTPPGSGTVVGLYQWNASYTGDANNNAASDNNDPAEQTTMSPATASTSTDLALVPAVTYGSETAETFIGNVTGPSGDGRPDGSVVVTSGGQTLCTAGLTAGTTDSAKFSCSLSAFQLPAGSYTMVAATYLPSAPPDSSNSNYVYNGSTSAQFSFTVDQAQEATSTTLNVGAPTVTYGSEGAEVFTGTVAGVHGYGLPEGTVQVLSGSTVLCSSPLSAASPDSATYSCALSDAQLDVASYPVQAVYEPASAASSDPSVTYAFSTATPGSFTVNPEVVSTTTTLTASAPQVTYGSENAETLSGSVTGEPSAGVPQGSVVVTADAITVCVLPLTASGLDSATYTCTLAPSQLHAGSYAAVQASYQPATPSSPNPDYVYSASDGGGSFTIAKALPVITWSNPANIVFGTLLSSTQLDAAASVPGAFAYSPAAGTLLPPGSGQALQVSFTPADATDYTTASDTVHINVTSLACVTGSASSGLTVGSGQAGCVTGGTVTSGVTVKSGGAFYMRGGIIKGSLTVIGAKAVWLCNVMVTGGITITGSTGPVLVGGTGCKNTIGGSVSLTNNTGGVTYLGNMVSGSLTITGNSGPFDYIAGDNTTTGKVTVKNNT